MNTLNKGKKMSYELASGSKIVGLVIEESISYVVVRVEYEFGKTYDLKLYKHHIMSERVL